MSHPNGLIPSNLLTSIGDGHTLEARAARSWMALVAAAKRAGHSLTLTDSYRPRSVQESIFFQRYIPQATGGGFYGDAKTYNNIRYVRKAGTASAATPGTSLHGSGFAVDIAGINAGFGNAPSSAYQWLAKNAGAYGWANPAWAKTKNFWEPWHWEYNAATDTKPTPPTPAGEIDETTMRRIHIQTTAKRKPQAIKKNVWTTIQINDKNDVSLLTIPGVCDAQLQLALKGVPKGREVQVRFVLAATEPNGSKGKVTTRYPITELIGTDGGTFGNVTQKGVLPKPGKGQASIRLRAQILVFNDGITITSAQARTDVYPS